MSHFLMTFPNDASLDDLLGWLLQSPHAVPPIPSVRSWRERWREMVEENPDAVTLALRGGFKADRIGWAFAAGYQAALRALLPQTGADEVLALTATEEAGNRPRDIETLCSRAADGWRLHGRKSWVTLGDECSALLVVARLATESERPQLKLLRVPATAEGLRWLPARALPFIPEVPHSQCELEAVTLPAAAMLPGDGYSDYVKPFRTIEDVFVSLALLAYALREARARGWPQALQARLTAVLCSVVTLAGQHPSAAPGHVALAGALALAAELYGEISVLMQQAEDESAARWLRDAPLFGVAGKARAARTARGWELLAAAR